MTNVERMKAEKQASATATSGDKKTGNFPTEYVKKTSLYVFPKKGKTVGRLVGDFKTIASHELAPNDRLPIPTKGVAPKELFGPKDDQIPYSVKCKNWDEENEVRVKGGCEFCTMHWRAHDMKDWETDPAQVKTFKTIDANTGNKLKSYSNWISRDDPYYIKKVKKDDKWEEVKVKGNKLLVIPPKVMEQILSIMREKKIDLSNPDTGYDIEIMKQGEKQDTTWTVSFSLDSEMSAKKTPLTDEERKYEIWDPSKIVYEACDFAKIFPKLHKPMRDIFEIPEEKFLKEKEAHKKAKAGKASATPEEATPTSSAVEEEAFAEPPAGDILNEEEIPF